LYNFNFFHYAAWLKSQFLFKLIITQQIHKWKTLSIILSNPSKSFTLQKKLNRSLANYFNKNL